jgi:hypothetical protein
MGPEVPSPLERLDEIRRIKANPVNAKLRVDRLAARPLSYCLAETNNILSILGDYSQLPK